MARTRRYMHGRRRKCASPFKHGDMPHPKGATGEEIDASHSDIYGRNHNESDHERWAKPDTPAVDEEPDMSKKEARQTRRQLIRRDRKAARQQRKDDRRNG